MYALFVLFDTFVFFFSYSVEDFLVLCLLMSLPKYCTVGAIINFVFFHYINSTAELMFPCC